MAWIPASVCRLVVLPLDDLGQDTLSLHLSFIACKMRCPSLSDLVRSRAWESCGHIQTWCVWKCMVLMLLACIPLDYVFHLELAWNFQVEGVVRSFQHLPSFPSCDFRARGQWTLLNRKIEDLCSWVYCFIRDSYNFWIWLRHFDIIEKVEYEAYNKLSILSLKW